MKISPPVLVVYGRSAQDALEVIWRRKLRNCELFPAPILGLHFAEPDDLLLFAKGLNCEFIREGRLAIIPPELVREARNFLSILTLRDPVETVELIGILFWDTDDRAIIDEEFGRNLESTQT